MACNAAICHLFSRLMEEAAARSCLAGLVTFRNHPASVLRHDFVPLYLTTVEERMRLIQDLGVDFVVPLTFDLELSKMGAMEFVTLLQKNMRIVGLVVGPDFAMGHNREGDTKMLGAIGRDMGFSVTVVKPLFDGELPIRSNVIREAAGRATSRRLPGSWAAIWS